MRRKELLGAAAVAALYLGISPASIFSSPARGETPEAGEVSLPLSAYDELVRSAAPAELPAEPAPTLSAATLDIVAGDEVASAELRFAARSDRRTPVDLPLGGDWPAESRAITPPTATLARRGDALFLRLPGPGEWKVDLKTTVAVEPAGDLVTVRLPIPGFSAVEGRLTIPSGNADVKLSGAAILSRTSEPARTVVRFATSAGELTATIRAAGGRKNGPLHYGDATVDTEERIEENFLRATSAVRVSLESGRTDSLTFSVPADCDVLSVRGDAVAGFDTKDGRLVVRLGTTATSESPGIHLQIALSRAFQTGRFQPPFPVVAIPATYRLALFPSETLEVSMAEPGAFEDADAASVDVAGITPGADDILIAHRAKSPAPPVYDSEKRKEGKVLALTIPVARFTTIASERGTAVTAAEYVVQTRSRASLRIVLPAGAEFWEADEGGRPIVASREPDGAIILPLGSITSRNRVRVLFQTPGTSWKEKERLDLGLPATTAPISRATWAITIPGGWNATLARDSAWKESGAVAPETDEAPAGAKDEDARFIEKNRGDAPGTRGAVRGIVVALPVEGPKTFSASLLEGEPPRLALDVKKERPEGDWR